MRDYRVGNDTPVWFKPRRTVWFVLRPDGQLVCDAAGRDRYFPSMEAADRLRRKLVDKLPEIA